MTGRLASLRDRPIAEHERRTAMVTVVALLAATALGLAFSQPGGESGSASGREVHNVVGGARLARGASGAATTTAPLIPAVRAAAERFMAGYLSYVYGHTPASRVQGASASFSRSLEADPRRVPPGVRALKARVVALRSAPAPVGLVGVSALINDGGLVDYPIGLLLSSKDGRLLVTGLAGE